MEVCTTGIWSAYVNNQAFVVTDVWLFVASPVNAQQQNEASAYHTTYYAVGVANS